MALTHGASDDRRAGAGTRRPRASDRNSKAVGAKVDDTRPIDLVAAPGSPRHSFGKLARRFGIRHVTADVLRIRRMRRGEHFSYLAADGSPIKDRDTLRRLKKLAVPPAYDDVHYAEDPRAHLQAIGRDAAGRLQYRYHPDWEKARELRKARRLAALAQSLPKIRRSVSRHLSGKEPSKAFALAAVIELLSCSAIRPGNDSYTRLHGSRGATTLLKANVRRAGKVVSLSFKAKGGKRVSKDIKAPRLARIVDVLARLPGRRLFQYATAEGEVRRVSSADVNQFLREIAGVRVSLKDFRTLLASLSVLDALAREEPAANARARRRQVLKAIRSAAIVLDNTPAVCGRSYVHRTVIEAFEDGKLRRFSDELRQSRSPARRERALAQIVASAARG